MSAVGIRVQCRNGYTHILVDLETIVGGDMPAAPVCRRAQSLLF